MHVRVRAASGEEHVIPVVSRQSGIEELRKAIYKKYSVTLAMQRLFYGGKLLENGYTLHDYSIRLNDVIQLMVQDEHRAQEQQKPRGKVYKDAKSNLYAVGDLIDMRDHELGAWFEGTILRIVKDPEYEPPAEPLMKGNYDTCDAESSKTLNVKKNRLKTGKKKAKDENSLNPKSEVKKQSQTTKGKYFGKTPKINIKLEAFGTAFINNPQTNQEDLDMDVGILYKISLIYDDIKEELCHYCKSVDIRPRARREIEFHTLHAGQTVLLNYNMENHHEKGYWYDYTVLEVLKQRKCKELVGTLWLGPKAVPQNNTKIKVLDKIYAIEEVVPVRNRTEKQKKIMTTPPEQRAMPLECLRCRDKEDRPCRECGCGICSSKKDPDKIILCDECNTGFHMTCLKPPLSFLPDEDWYCSDCKRDPNEVVAPGAARQPKKAKGKKDWGRGMACAGKTKTCAMPANHFGPIPGIEVGMLWRFRIQLSESGVHRPPVSGIHGRDTDGAYSLVLSGGYEDDLDHGMEFIYTGSGGRDLSGNKRIASQSFDQTLTRENRALARNCAVSAIAEEGQDAREKWRDGKPVRVVRSHKMKKHFPTYAPNEGVRYDGIYKVVKYYPETGISGFRVWKYLLRRDDPNPAPWESGAKKFPIIFPEGYLEAEVEKHKMKLAKSKKRVLRGSNHYGSDEDFKNEDSDYTGPLAKKRSGGDTPPMRRKSLRSTRQKTSKDSLSTRVKPKSPTSEKSPNKPPKKSPKIKRVSLLSTVELNAIRADKHNYKLWEECLDIYKNNGKQQLINDIRVLFLCCICQEVVVNPVTTPCQHNFCMKCLKHAFQCVDWGHYCPYCRQDLPKENLEYNETLKTALRILMPGYDVGKL